MIISWILLLILEVSAAEGSSATIDPRFQLSFDGFVIFLKELALLRGRYQKVQETGRALSSRIDYLEAAILKTNMTVGNPIEKMTAVTEKTRYLNIQMVNTTYVVNEAKAKMRKLQENTSNTTKARMNLARLANGTDTHLLGLLDFTNNLTSSVHDINTTAQDLQSEKDSFEKRLAEISKTTKRIEMMGCDTGFSYDNFNGQYSKTTTVHYPRPFNGTPSMLYGLTRLDTAILGHYSYYYNLNVTLSNVDNSGVSLSVLKDRYSQIKLSEVNWMACYI